MNYQIVLFKNKIKKKIINKFKTHKRANEFYESLLSETNTVLFEKEYENGSICSYELALIEKTSGTFLPIFLKDELGRRVKVNLEDDDYTISSISKYKIEELILDTTTNKKINSQEFIKLYLDPTGFKLVSKLHNKIIVQNDDTFNLITLKNESDASRFIDIISEKFMDDKRNDCIFVKDYTTTQRKYLYELLISKGFSKNYLHRQSTTHLVKT